MRDFVCKVWCPSQCPHIVAFYITVQCLSEPSVALGTHSLLRRSRQHNTPYGAGGCHTSSSCFVFLCVFLGALLGSGTCVKGAPHVTRASRRRVSISAQDSSELIQFLTNWGAICWVMDGTSKQRKRTCFVFSRSCSQRILKHAQMRLHHAGHHFERTLRFVLRSSNKTSNNLKCSECGFCNDIYTFFLFTVLFTTEAQTCSNAFALRRPSL